MFYERATAALVSQPDARNGVYLLSRIRSTAHRRFQHWVRAGVLAKLWQQGLTDYDELKGIDWRWQSMDGAMTKAPLGGGKKRPQPDGSSQTGREA